MKKTMALVMAACMAGATLVGCGSSASSAAPAGDSSTSNAASSSDKLSLIHLTEPTRLS